MAPRIEEPGPRTRPVKDPGETNGVAVEATAREDAEFDAPPVEAPIHRVRKAYEQVYDQLRELIVKGEFARGQRLPNEAVLASNFGVSRGTVREALRVLAAQNLIRTAKGAGGGSFVTMPTVDHISEFLQANISLLSEANDVTLDEFLEARELLEVFAARRAAQRRTEAHLVALRDTIMTEPERLSTQEQFSYNKEFHSAVMGACGNTLLCIAAQPVFSILQTNLRRSPLAKRFPVRVNDDHGIILQAIEAGDADAAGEAMTRHMAYLRRTYQRMWAGRDVAAGPGTSAPDPHKR
jgi:GntR family transcriptional regulator, transcriptional repressor for pyruvate dehydrogenase complex